MLDEQVPYRQLDTNNSASEYSQPLSTTADWAYLGFYSRESVSHIIMGCIFAILGSAILLGVAVAAIVLYQASVLSASWMFPSNKQ